MNASAGIADISEDTGVSHSVDDFRLVDEWSEIVAPGPSRYSSSWRPCKKYFACFVNFICLK